MSELRDVPNLGSVLIGRLKAIGIENPEPLYSLGSKDVFAMLYEVDSSLCINVLYALEGAVQGIRWHHLDKDIKIELKNFYIKLTQSK